MAARVRARVVEETVQEIDALTTAERAIERGDLKSARDAVARAFELTMRRAPAVSVSVAAKLLDVSEPTVRKWIVRGVLERSPGKPAGVSLRSFRQVQTRVTELREHGKDPTVRELLLARIDDRLLAQEGWVQEGLARLKSGTGADAGTIKVELKPKRSRRTESELPSIESLGGSDPDFTGDLTTGEYLRMRRGTGAVGSRG